MKPRDSCVKLVDTISVEKQSSVLSAASVNFIMKKSDGIAKSDALINSGIASQSEAEKAKLCCDVDNTKDKKEIKQSKKSPKPVAKKSASKKKPDAEAKVATKKVKQMEKNAANEVRKGDLLIKEAK